MKIVMACTVAGALTLPTTTAVAAEKALEATVPVTEETKPGLPAGLLYTDSHVTAAESGSFLALGWFPANDFTLYAGLGFTFDPNGSVKDSLGVAGGTNDKVASDLVVGAGYFVIDNIKANIFMGPEVVWLANLAPHGFADVNILEAAWAMRYGLWKTPVAIGTDLGVTFTSVSGLKGPSISTAPFGLHIVYAFN